MTVLEIGCCGAYCGTCKARREGPCKGCKSGYDTGQRDIARARCAIKVCCFGKRGFQTCADCSDIDICPIIREWSLKGYKYARYREQIEYIRRNGYEAYLSIAVGWKDAKGRL